MIQTWKRAIILDIGKIFSYPETQEKQHIMPTKKVPISMYAYLSYFVQ